MSSGILIDINNCTIRNIYATYSGGAIHTEFVENVKINNT